MTRAGGERLRRSDRLRARRDFQRVAREGARVSSRSFILLAAPRYDDPGAAWPRLGVTASKRLGSAVVRARVRRRVREWFRRSREHLPRGKDIVVIARSCAVALPWDEFVRELETDAGRLRTVVERAERTP